MPISTLTAKGQDAGEGSLAPLWKLPLVLKAFPVSRSAWLAGVKAGRYPAPVRLSPRSVAWRSEDIRALVAAL